MLRVLVHSSLDFPGETNRTGSTNRTLGAAHADLTGRLLAPTHDRTFHTGCSSITHPFRPSGIIHPGITGMTISGFYQANASNAVNKIVEPYWKCP